MSTLLNSEQRTSN